MSSLEKLVPRTRLRTRSLQWQLKSNWSIETDSPHLPISQSQQVDTDIAWWMSRDHLFQGAPFGATPPPPPRTPPVLGRISVGVGSLPPRSVSIGTMVGPGDLPPYKHLGDESPVPSPEGLQGLSHQPESNGYVRQFHGGSLCLQTGRNSLGLPLRVDRATSPLDGRQQCPPRSEVPPRTIERLCGSAQPLQPGPGGGVVSSPTSGEEDHPHMVIPTIDLFATHLNAKLPLYCSLIPDPQALFEDAFRHPWNHLDVYAFPPFGLVDRVVARVRETPNLSMTLIAPLWPEKAWFADLLLLLTQSPLTLPIWDRLLRQPHFNRFHGGVYALNLHAWRLSSVSSESQAFRDGLRTYYPHTSGSPLHACTNRSGSRSVIGVVDGALLHSAPLYLL